MHSPKMIQPNTDGRTNTFDEQKDRTILRYLTFRLRFLSFSFDCLSMIVSCVIFFFFFFFFSLLFKHKSSLVDENQTWTTDWIIDNGVSRNMVSKNSNKNKIHRANSYMHDHRKYQHEHNWIPDAHTQRSMILVARSFIKLCEPRSHCIVCS